MVQAWVIKGRLVDARTVELDEPVDRTVGEVEVIVCGRPDDMRRAEPGLAAFLRGLPPGTRTKEEIDRQVTEERDSWT
jgi:hypothetical protein